MSLPPLFSASRPIVLRAFAAPAQFGLGGVQLALPKGTLRHRALGWSRPVLCEEVRMTNVPTQRLAAVALLVPDYDEALAYFTRVLGFDLAQDSDMGGGKRFVVVTPPGGAGAALVLARAARPAQAELIGNQAGGRVFLFLHTDDFARDHAAFIARGVEFREAPRQEPYGTVAVFRDRYGNLWDLIQPRTGSGLQVAR